MSSDGEDNISSVETHTSNDGGTWTDIDELTETTVSYWDYIVKETVVDNIDVWQKLVKKDQATFQRRFKESYLEDCKSWLIRLRNFEENDHI